MLTKIFSLSEFEALPEHLEGQELIKALDSLNGGFAAVYSGKSGLWLLRDRSGIIPLFYSTKPRLGYSESKAGLKEGGFRGIRPINPRTAINFTSSGLEKRIIKRKFFSRCPLIKEPPRLIFKEVLSRVEMAVRERAGSKQIGVLFSGGVDSALIALLLKKLGKGVVCYTACVEHAGIKPPADLPAAIGAAEELGLKLRIIRVKLEEVERLAAQVIQIIGNTNPVKVGVGLPIFVASLQARQEGKEMLFSGLGSEELFAGYMRHRQARDVNSECLAGLLSMWHRDCERDFAIANHLNLGLLLPFLDRRLVEYALRIPGELKLNSGGCKLALREAALLAGLPREIAFRPKKAAQYGSGFDHALELLARRRGLRHKGTYLAKLGKIPPNAAVA